jgi:hypothetical protein
MTEDDRRNARASWWSRRSWRAKGRLIVYPSLLLGIVGFCCFAMSMPGASHRGPLAPLDSAEMSTAVLLRRDVLALAGDIGERNMFRADTLARSRATIEQLFREAGCTPAALEFAAGTHTVANLEATRAGSTRPSEIVVVGAHYDTALHAPGADDNASGVAALLVLMRAVREPLPRTVRFVAFANEEPPNFYNDSMGSLQYARACKARGDDIVAMISLESLGYYTDDAGSQRYPPVVSLFYPDRGDFVAFVGNLSSRALVREAIGAFRDAVQFPSEGAALPSEVPGVGWSDQWSFWQCGYPGLMVTDTAPFRNPNYHTPNDKPDTLDYERLARVTTGLIAVVRRLGQ